MDGKCCSECGATLQTITLEIPTDLLRSLGSGTLGWDDIGDLFEDLTADYAEGEYNYGKPPGPSPHIDLGLEITCTGSNRDRDSDGRSAFSPVHVISAISKIAIALKNGGLGHLEINSYVVTTISC
jgi:hypothetical protein